MLGRRRDLLGGALAGAIGLVGSRPCEALASQTILPIPDLHVDPARPFEYVTGVRPVRAGGFRLESELIHDPASGDAKHVVHNYGHGGGGISLSWGCASLTMDQVKLVAPPGSEVAVIGAGIIGLTAAVALSQSYKVTVLAREVSSGSIHSAATTSDVAGGQWAPSFNGEDYATPSNPPQMDSFSGRMLIAASRAYARFISDMGVGANYVVPVKNYSADPDPSDGQEWSIIRDATALSSAPSQLTKLPSLPFPDLMYSNAPRRPGSVYDTLLINVPAMIRSLKAQLASRRVVIRPGVSFDDVASLFDHDRIPQSVIVNCTGLGSRTLFEDSDLQGVKGILALLPPDPRLLSLPQRYLFSGLGYMFPRSDATIVGGTNLQLSASDSTLVSGGQNVTGNFPAQAASDQSMAKLLVRLMAAEFAGLFPLGCNDFRWVSNEGRLLTQMCH